MKVLTTQLRIAVAAVGLLSAGCAVAGVKVDAAWARHTTASQKASGVFMKVTSSEGAVLIGAESPVAGRMEIHEMKMEGAIMRMRKVEEVKLPAGRPVSLDPNGYHLMVMDLREQLRAGGKISLTLKLRNGDGSIASVPVVADIVSPDMERSKLVDRSPHH